MADTTTTQRTWADVTTSYLYQSLLRMTETVLERLPLILLIVFVFVVLHRIMRVSLAKLEQHFLVSIAQKSEFPKESEKRITTIFGTVKRALYVIFWTLGILITLRACNVDIAPLLAAAGVLGLAIGLGAQGIVKDVFMGVILLVENHIRVNDVVVINGKSGLVEAINLRTIVLRDATGTLHVIPNGSVTDLSNQTIDWSASVINLTVAYDTDVDQLMEVMKAVGAELKADPKFSEKIIADLEMFGVTDFNDGNVSVRARIKTAPSDQWTVEREYRRRLKQALEVNRIYLPSRNIAFSSKAETALISAMSPEARAALTAEQKQQLSNDAAAATYRAATRARNAGAPTQQADRILDTEPNDSN
ncbi:MAG TPA: mechanosensitive ion channel family protein [Candidatus Sumerlaeota bacterium]|nr:mechanosensitive ion channel family protein [Candidatus Sumerlaeota bacterium]